MRYIGITGEQHTGKSTLAAGIQEAMPGTPHVEISDIITEVANEFRDLYVQTESTGVSAANQWLMELPEVLHSRLGLELSYGDFAFTEKDVEEQPTKYMTLLSYCHKMSQNPSFREEPITAANKEAHREILQAVGGAVVAIEPTAWYDEAYRLLNRKRVSLTSLGIVSTVAYPSDADYVRKHNGIIAKVIRPDNEAGTSTRLDPTDAARSLITAEVTIQNNGSKEQLFAAGKLLVNIVKRNDYPREIVCSEL